MSSLKVTLGSGYLALHLGFPAEDRLLYHFWTLSQVFSSPGNKTGHMWVHTHWKGQLSQGEGH